MKRFLILSLLTVAGCSTFHETDYHPKSSKEKKAYVTAVRGIPLSYVQDDLERHLGVEVGWAGIIKDIQFKETERTIQVAFEVEHREFDWRDHGGGRPYHLSAKGDGLF